MKNLETPTQSQRNNDSTVQLPDHEILVSVVLPHICDTSGQNQGMAAFSCQDVWHGSYQLLGAAWLAATLARLLSGEGALPVCQEGLLLGAEGSSHSIRALGTRFCAKVFSSRHCCS